MRSVFESFPNTKRVLFPEDIREINAIISFIDNALQNKRDILKYGTSLEIWRNPINNLLGFNASPLSISDSIDPDRGYEIEKNFRQEIVNEIDRYVNEKIEILRIQYHVSYMKE